MWTAAPPHPILTNDQIHIWHFRLDAAVDSKILSTDEQERAARFKVELPRRRYIAARAQMREILSRYAELAPRTLEFAYEAHGKPFLTRPKSNLEFNLTHADDDALLAVARYPVGVDLEHLRPMADAEYIVNSSFTALERTQLNTLSGEAHLHAFWRTWTRKEAIMKMLGPGFRIAQQYSVSVGEPPAVLEAAALPDLKPESCWLVDIPLNGKLIGSVALQGLPRTPALVLFNFA